MAPSRQASNLKTATPTHRISLRDVFAILLFAGWCALGIAKIAYDVAQYRAQQTAVAAFHTRYPDATFVTANQTPGGAIAKMPYDPALGKWLIGETVGYIVALTVALAGRRRVRGRRITEDVRWIDTGREVVVPDAILGQPRQALSQSAGVAADRVSVIVWSDRVARLEKEHA